MEQVQAARELPNIRNGEVEEAYSLGCTIGAGAFGKAVLATRKDNAEQVVVKQIRIADLTDKEKEEAINEVRVLATFDHLNIIKYKECIVQARPCLEPV